MRPCNPSLSSQAIEWRQEHQRVRIEAWSSGVIRVRATLRSEFSSHAPNALVSDTPDDCGATKVTDDVAWISTGGLACKVELGTGRVAFVREADGLVLLEEVEGNPDYPFVWPLARDFTSMGGELFKIDARFRPNDAERFFGLGQHRHGLWNQKGAVIDLFQRNGEVCIPLLISDRGYGFLWHQAGVGRVELATSGTHWVADGTYELDYLVLLGTPAAILQRYASLTGYPAEFPGWASGFWQSKLRYRSQSELLEVVREHRRRGYPLSVIVADFMHWEHQGDFNWDPVAWPDPAAMCAELRSLGVELMSSVWPTAQPKSKNWPRLAAEGLLVRTNRGPALVHHFTDTKEFPHRVDIAYLDATNPRTQQFLWAQVRENYLRHGCRVFWLDTCEPELFVYEHDNLCFDIGPATAVANCYPLEHQKVFFCGLQESGETAPLTLCRSAWLGSQRYGAAVWSGDIPSTWEMLHRTIRAGLNMAMSGLPWWTTDIGGFSGGDPLDPSFRHLLIRWFQYGTFCPIMRLHGQREPVDPKVLSGAPNEIWSFGSEAESILGAYLRIREQLREYIHAMFERTSQTGMPIMRPMAVEWPNQAEAWEIDDQYMFGDGLLIAPVVAERATTRSIWLPPGPRWINAWTGDEFDGGARVSVAAPLSQIPVMIRNDHAHLRGVFLQFPTVIPSSESNRSMAPVGLQIHTSRERTLT